MIRSITIENFKCFHRINIDLGKLNVFCGTNGVGKSSIIQAILIAREASQCADRPAFVKLNNLFKQDLGQVLDILHTNAIEEYIFFGFKTDEGDYSFAASADAQRSEDHFLNFNISPSNNTPCFQSRETGYFTYFSPERDGPRDTQQIQSVPVNCLQFGTSGEFIAEILATYERKIIRDTLCFNEISEDTPPKQLLPQLELWADYVFPGIKLKTVTSPGINAIGIRIMKGGIKDDWLKPTNVGFGISYCLPVLLGGLLGQENGLFIIDSPEAHLHPASQSRISQFLSQVANSNTQVIVETHSDHVLNGIRLAVAMGKIPADDVRIHYLNQNENSVFCEPISVKRDGSLSLWPTGFFDQIEKDLAKIVKSKRGLR